MIVVESSVYLTDVEVESIINLMQMDVEVESLIPAIVGQRGKSAYESYLAITTDQPPLTEEEWAQLIPTLKAQVNNLETSLDVLKEEPEEIQQFNSYLNFPNLGNSNVLYIDSTENESYRWDSENLKYYAINKIDIQIINGGE